MDAEAQHRAWTAPPQAFPNDPRAHWFGPTGGRLLGWVTRPTKPTGSGIVIVPPVGYTWWTAHGTLRAVAEDLTARGAMVLRYDHYGSGDSSGSSVDEGRLEKWRQGVVDAAAELRRLGCTELCLVGLEIGATLAFLEVEATGARAIVAIAPAQKGRRQVRQLRMMANEIPDPDYPDGSLETAGTVLLPDLLDGLGEVDIAEVSTSSLRAALVIEPEGQPQSSTASILEGRGVATTRKEADLEPFLGQPTEYATVPSDVISEIGTWWAGLDRPEGVGPVETESLAELQPGPVHISDEATAEVVEVAGLTGIWCEPISARRGSLVFLNSGSEPHVGPGRAWVEYARALAEEGWASLRVDFSGWGESPDRGHAPGRPYDPHCVAETEVVAQALEDHGHLRPVLLGLCAGAWAALRAAADGAPVGGVIAINPQLYWQPGDPVEADIVSETHVRRLDEIAHHRRFARLGVWSALDRLGVRHPAARWLDELTAARVPVLMVFAEDDDGLPFLEDRVGAAWKRAQTSGLITAVTIPDIDHPMHRHWLRPRVLDAVSVWLASLETASATKDPPRP